MARTLKGNLAGKAAHREAQELPDIRTEREVLEGRVRNAEAILNGMRGWTDTTAFAQAVVDAKEALELYDQAQWLAVGELPTDPRTEAERALDEWQKEVMDTRTTDYPM